MKRHAQEVEELIKNLRHPDLQVRRNAHQTLRENFPESHDHQFGIMAGVRLRRGFQCSRRLELEVFYQIQDHLHSLLRKSHRCGVCEGEGVILDYWGKTKCTSCKGRGGSFQDQNGCQAWMGAWPPWYDCCHCCGTGYGRAMCPMCLGRGYIIPHINELPEVAGVEKPTWEFNPFTTAIDRHCLDCVNHDDISDVCKLSMVGSTDNPYYRLIKQYFPCGEYVPSNLYDFQESQD